MARSPLRPQAESPGKSRWQLGLALLILGGILYLFVGGDEGLLEIRRQSRALSVLQTRVAQLQAENDSLHQILTMLEHDKDYIEKVAREEYGMVKPGEKIYRLQELSAGK